MIGNISQRGPQDYMGKLIFSVDVEPDLHDGENKGIQEGLIKFEKICDKNKIKPILFVVASCIPKNKEIFKRFVNKKWDISLHGLSHKRFDDMSYEEKEYEIKESIKIFKKYLGIKPKGFRAPQHSIDNETLDLLEKYKFEYDSSMTPLNFLQFLFFPSRPKRAVFLFFSRPWKYKIRNNLEERPVASFILPAVSLVVRVFPKWILKIYFFILKLFYREIMFYSHSWDFIELKESRIDRKFSHTNLLKKLNFIMGHDK